MTAIYSRTHPGKCSLWIDWETTGADFDQGYNTTFTKYQGISIGLVIADNETFEEVDSLYVEFKFDPSYEWTDGAEKVHGLSREHLEQHGVTQEEGLAEIIEFLMKHFGDKIISTSDTMPAGKVQIGGHNVDFDITGLQTLFHKFGLRLGVHHVKLETSGAAFIAIGEYRSNVTFELLGNTVRAEHNALEDARLALSVARSIRNLVADALGV